MRLKPIALLLLLAAGCATAPRARALQYAEAIKAAQSSTVTAVEYGLVTAQDAERVQTVLRVAIADFERLVAALKSGQPDVDRWLNAIEDALTEAQRLLVEGNQ